MAYFEDRNFEKVRSSLELIPGASLTDTSKGDHCVSTWNPQAELSFMHKQFLRTATLLQDQRQTNHKYADAHYLQSFGTILFVMLDLEFIWNIWMWYELV